jgi:hypothetical protein
MEKQQDRLIERTVRRQNFSLKCTDYALAEVAREDFRTLNLLDFAVFVDLSNRRE